MTQYIRWSNDSILQVTGRGVQLTSRLTAPNPGLTRVFTGESRCEGRGLACKPVLTFPALGSMLPGTHGTLRRALGQGSLSFLAYPPLCGGIRFALSWLERLRKKSFSRTIAFC